MLSTHNFDYEEFHNGTKHKLILNKNTLTEKLICQDRIIYEAPICTCLSCFLNDDMKKMQRLTKKSIHNNIAAILSQFGIDFTKHQRMEYEQRNNSMCFQLLGLTSLDDLEKYLSINNPNSNDNVQNFHSANEIISDLTSFEQIFSYNTYWDDSSFTPQRDVLRGILKDYITNLKSDPICKELQFFYYVFNNGEFYTFSENDAIDFFSLESAFSHKTFDYLRQNYIATQQARQCYNIEDYQDICVLTLHFALKNGLTINKCQNCGLYFIPRKRSDEMYCDNPSPQNSEKTCKQYGSTTLCYRREKDDPVLCKCRNLLSAKQMNAKRHADISVYTENYNTFKQESAQWKKRYKAGECTADEFIAWLNEQKARKT